MYVRPAASAVEETVPPAKPCVPGGTIGNDAPAPAREASPEDSPEIGTSSVEAAANRRTVPISGTSSVEAAARRRTAGRKPTPTQQTAAR